MGQQGLILCTMEPVSTGGASRGPGRVHGGQEEHQLCCIAQWCNADYLQVCHSALWLNAEMQWSVEVMHGRDAGINRRTNGRTSGLSC